uniref:Terpene synthase metal-binding domain-containing protein n=1 Tax=Rhizophora mucronata TaxID=61149 RepID=A0A2P2P0L4_RHIMU
MINELGSVASHRQGRSVTHHLVKIWHDLLKSMKREADWARENVTPTLDEYMENACISFALGPVILVPLFSIGPKLSEEVLASQEYDRLFKHISSIGRLLNDLASVKLPECICRENVNKVS